MWTSAYTIPVPTAVSTAMQTQVPKPVKIIFTTIPIHRPENYTLHDAMQGSDVVVQSEILPIAGRSGLIFVEFLPETHFLRKIYLGGIMFSKER